MKKSLLRTTIIVVFCLIFNSWLSAQSGGTNTYNFLNLTKSARVAALGGNFLTIYDHDLSLALSNPSLISPQMHNNLSLNFTDSYSGSNFGFASYGYHFNKLGSFVGAMQFISTGKTDNTDENGTSLGQFSTGEYAFNVGWARMLDSVFSIGANIKFIYSGLETYHSTGIAADIAGSYVPNETFCASLIFRNIGRQLTTYSTAGAEPLPFEIQAGISKKLAHVPFRYSLLLQHLEKWDLSYADPNAEVDQITGEIITKSKIETFTNNALRHLVIGGEFIPAKFLSIRLGYNYLRREEMKVATKAGMVGFSWGIGLKISKFNFSYSRSAYHINGSPNYLSISTNLGGWGK